MASSVVFFLVASSFISCPVGTNPKAKLMGYLAQTVDIDYTGRVYIDKGDVDAISKIKPVGCEVSVVDGKPNYRYYYNSTPDEGKIISVREIRNDRDSFCHVVDYLYSEMFASMDRKWRTESALGYVRSFNSAYCSDSSQYRKLWDYGAGKIDYGFVQWEDANRASGISIKDYFASFLDDGQLDRAYHPKLIKGRAKYQVIDPFNPSGSVDVIHRAATRDGVHSKTGGLWSDAETRALFGWAGDLQTSKSNFKSEYQVNESTLFENTGAFSFSDLSADIDGFNVAYSMNFDEPIGTQMIHYYRGMNGQAYYRYFSFISKTVKDFYPDSSNWSTGKIIGSFEKIVYDRMALELSDSGTVKDITSSHPIKYHFLDKDGRPSRSTRSAIAKTFTRYILSKAGYPEEIKLK